MITVTHRVNLPGTGPVEVPIAEYGSGQPFLLLHGGAGPASVTGFAEKFAAAHQVRVLVPAHPGFGGTARPEKLDSVAGLAPLYQALLDELALSDVTVIGNSIGGWIAAEIALLKSPRVSGIVLIDAVGIEVPGHPVADFFSLSMDQVFQLTFHNPEPFRIDPTALPPAAQAIAAGNRAAIAVYAGAAMADPTLRERLGSLEIPTLVLWGESDGIVDVAYGRAYAAAIPMARFQLLPETGHAPQQETPDQVIRAIWERPASA
ncbi:pimeloyl-ACP methyl ester carboxylesterase [Kitasatospora sp. GAS204A]|uniref:alpha/beta fold hydrolase n=1 Tax=unclassified Kitasatospora TaxID=2633591 RepID=UPI002476B35E|nr:alpha/beta hydrolase [Kitasatospora sp. GAS204B]MDH6120126.1 pimeloyl-ACP methyl ester carboxylesterase [Kitasatospora sp. GAS204B]